MASRQFQSRNIDLRKLKRVIEEWFIEQDYETQTKSGEKDHLVQAKKEGTFRTGC